MVLCLGSFIPSTVPVPVNPNVTEQEEKENSPSKEE